MKLTSQKRVAASLVGCSEKRIKFDPLRLDEIKEAITKRDLESLIKDKAIIVSQKKSVSRVRARKKAIQKTKGRQRGTGKRKGKYNARSNNKEKWIMAIRAQKRLLKTLRDKEVITKSVYHSLYNRAKGGFFRSLRHIKLHIEERNLSAKK